MGPYFRAGSGSIPQAEYAVFSCAPYFRGGRQAQSQCRSETHVWSRTYGFWPNGGIGLEPPRNTVA